MVPSKCSSQTLVPRGQTSTGARRPHGHLCEGDPDHLRPHTLDTSRLHGRVGGAYRHQGDGGAGPEPGSNGVHTQELGEWWFGTAQTLTVPPHSAGQPRTAHSRRREPPPTNPTSGTRAENGPDPRIRGRGGPTPGVKQMSEYQSDSSLHRIHPRRRKRSQEGGRTWPSTCTEGDGRARPHLRPPRETLPRERPRFCNRCSEVARVLGGLSRVRVDTGARGLTLGSPAPSPKDVPHVAPPLAALVETGTFLWRQVRGLQPTHPACPTSHTTGESVTTVTPSVQPGSLGRDCARWLPARDCPSCCTPDQTLPPRPGHSDVPGQSPKDFEALGRKIFGPGGTEPGTHRGSGLRRDGGEWGGWCRSPNLSLRHSNAPGTSRDLRRKETHTGTSVQKLPLLYGPQERGRVHDRSLPGVGVGHPGHLSSVRAASTQVHRSELPSRLAGPWRGSSVLKEGVVQCPS